MKIKNLKYILLSTLLFWGSTTIAQAGDSNVKSSSKEYSYFNMKEYSEGTSSTKTVNTGTNGKSTIAVTTGKSNVVVATPEVVVEKITAESIQEQLKEYCLSDNPQVYSETIKRNECGSGYSGYYYYKVYNQRGWDSNHQRCVYKNVEKYSSKDCRSSISTGANSGGGDK